MTIEPQLRLLLERFGSGRAWYHGDLEGTLQGLLVLNFSPQTGVGGGATVGLRYRMMIEKRIQPFVEGGLGIGGIDFNLSSQDDGFEFFIEAGLGARYRLTSSVALAASLHWQHISNAQTHLPNVGIDTIGFMLAIETP
ncbi:MAG: acyloxyacyl hydrolase [Myxococcota bacterium]|nr:acyloxyacyl hydrolase [Myxococcota bacterium]